MEPIFTDRQVALLAAAVVNQQTENKYSSANGVVSDAEKFYRFLTKN